MAGLPSPPPPFLSRFKRSIPFRRRRRRRRQLFFCTGVVVLVSGFSWREGKGEAFKQPDFGTRERERERERDIPEK